MRNFKEALDQVGEKVGSQEIALLEYFYENGYRLGVEIFPIDSGSGEEMVNQILKMREEGKLPGLKEGIRNVNIIVTIKGLNRRLLPIPEVL